MQLGLPPSRASALRPALLMLLGLAVLGAAAGLALRSRDTPRPLAAHAPVASPPAPSAAGTAGIALPKPSFDVVRVNPHGDAVMAGRAAPGTDVTIMDGGKVIGRAQADGHGDWVFVPSTPLAPGARQLTLAERTSDGREQAGDGSVLLVVPGPPGAAGAVASPPLAVATAPNAAPRVLAGPSAAGSAADRDRLALGAVDYDERGEIRLAGHAPPGTSVHVYVDDHPIGVATADADGRWTLSPREPIDPGTHNLRLDETSVSGSGVIARVELPFQREQLAGRALAADSVVVQPGNSLWVLAHQAYGSGVRYTVIYQANRAQIRDPDLIYPGQVFALPVAAGTRSGTAMPVSSNMSR